MLDFCYNRELRREVKALPFSTLPAPTFVTCTCDGLGRVEVLRGLPGPRFDGVAGSLLRLRFFVANDDDTGRCPAELCFSMSLAPTFVSWFPLGFIGTWAGLGRVGVLRGLPGPRFNGVAMSSLRMLDPATLQKNP